ncbi:DUF2523 family protein [Stutzerimonas chloritidismutans]|jgi:hypothetical protein|uniref:DUF2523 family protein n=1 Tax=Stutzerimonas chloritidismutans TaxID=203192 RepID=A0ABU9M864_STUCH
MDLGFIADFFNNVQNFFGDIWEFMTTGIYAFFKEALVVITKAIIYSYFQSALFALEIAYTVVQEIVADVGVTQQVQSAYSMIPSDIRGTLSFFNVPQGLSLIFSAIPTRWALKFVPFVGR